MQSMKRERDGVQQQSELEVWIDHITVPWPISTKDRLEYLGRRWKISRRMTSTWARTPTPIRRIT
ncbi:MAG: hypothetical protein R6V19_08120 [Armatimonadota bacterium]